MELTRDTRHAYRRLAMASQVMADPDASPRMLRSARISFFRALRILGDATGSPEVLNAARLYLAGTEG